MAARKKWHSEAAWAKQPDHVIRCVGTLRDGRRCRKVAEDGTNVCELHGGLAPQVQAAAAQRMLHSAPAAAEALLRAMNDPAVPWGVRVKIMQDVLDRSNVVGKTIHEVAIKVDPAVALLQALADDPDGFMPAKPVQPPSQPAELESGEVVQGELVDPVQDAYDRYAESHTPDAEVFGLFGQPGPYDYRGKEAEPENGDPKPAPPVPGWRPPDDVA